MKQLIVTLFSIFLFAHGAIAAEIIDITFPVDGEATFTDDFNDARTGHIHHATDIIAPKMTPVLAAQSGRVSFAPMEEPSYGFMLSIDGDDGYEYNYIHLNNDTPGTDDGAGDPEYAYAPGIRRGAYVERGEKIAYVGDSGNAESVGAHLHFEIYDGDTAINPYPSLLAAYGNIAYSYNPEAEKAAAETINDDQDIPEADRSTNCESGTLIRTDEFSTVYYCGRDGGRYVFQNESTFFSWYTDFDDVVWISREAMGSLPIKGAVTYRPGTYLVKLVSAPQVYAVGHNGELHFIPSAETAEALYGANWAKLVRDLPDTFWPAYDVGEEVVRTD